MKTEIKQVTPELASQWLEKNTSNRPVRIVHVAYLAREMSEGLWKLTHQGIAFNKNGELVDGQHRLKAVVASNTTVPMLISWGVEDVFDNGIPRTIGDLLHIPPSFVAIYNTLLDTTRHGIGANSRIKPTLPDMQKLDTVFGGIITTLLNKCKTVSRIYASAGVRTAAVLQVHNGVDEEFVYDTYTSLNHHDFDKLPPLANSFVRWASFGDGPKNIRATTSMSDIRNELMVRAFYVFDKNKSNIQRMRITPEQFLETNETIKQEVLKILDSKQTFDKTSCSKH